MACSGTIWQAGGRSAISCRAAAAAAAAAAGGVTARRVGCCCCRCCCCCWRKPGGGGVLLLLLLLELLLLLKPCGRRTAAAIAAAGGVTARKAGCRCSCCCCCCCWRKPGGGGVLLLELLAVGNALRGVPHRLEGVCHAEKTHRTPSVGAERHGGRSLQLGIRCVLAALGSPCWRGGLTVACPAVSVLVPPASASCPGRGPILCPPARCTARGAGPVRPSVRRPFLHIATRRRRFAARRDRP